MENRMFRLWKVTEASRAEEGKSSSVAGAKGTEAGKAGSLRGDLGAHLGGTLIQNTFMQNSFSI